MVWIALVSSGEFDPGTRPAGCREVGGITLVERQVRQALHAGAAGVWLVAPDLDEGVAARIAGDGRVTLVPKAADLMPLVERESGDPAPAIVLFEPGILVDERLIARVAAQGAPRLLAYTRDAPSGAERLDAGAHWAGLARLPLGMVRDTLARLGDWDLTGTLVRTAVEDGVPRLAVGSLPTYAPGRRRILPFLWFRPESDADARAATEALIDSAQKGCLDWPARFIHPPIENQIVRWLLPTPVTPNMVTVAGGVLGFIAMFCFAIGHLWWGLALVLVCGPLDGVDGKLARTRHQYSRWGDLEHALDKILEYGWFLAIGWWFATGAGHGLAAWLTVGIIIVFSFSEAVKGEWFRRLTSRQLDDWGPFERRFRVVGGRRNTYFWTWIAYAAFGRWWEGLLFLMVYAVLTWAVAEWRLMRAIARYGCEVSPEIRRNFDQTAYAFLPQTEDSLAHSSS